MVDVVKFVTRKITNTNVPVKMDLHYQMIEKRVTKVRHNLFLYMLCTDLLYLNVVNGFSN